MMCKLTRSVCTSFYRISVTVPFLDPGKPFNSKAAIQTNVPVLNFPPLKLPSHFSVGLLLEKIRWP
jgi:hypothetical protein